MNFTRKTKTSSGYILVHYPNHPYARKSGYILYHRLVMEKKLRRYVKSEELVHHINGNITDNKPENLLLTNRKAHMSGHDNLGNNAKRILDRFTKFDKQKIKELLGINTLKQIAIKYKCSIGTIQRVLYGRR